MRWMVFLLAIGGWLPAGGQIYPGRPGYPDPFSRNPNPSWSRLAIDYDRQFSTLKRAAEELKTGAAGPGEIERLNSLHSDADFLQTRWRLWLQRNREPYLRPREFDRYFESLKRLNEALDRAGQTDDAGEREALVEFVAEDLEMKARSCRESEDGLGKEIWVKVRTVAVDEEVGGYQVWFVPRGLHHVERAHDHFYKLSSPTDEMALPPGVYLMWAKQGDLMTEPVVQRLGDKGRPKVEIDLVVPGDEP